MRSTVVQPGTAVTRDLLLEQVRRIHDSRVFQGCDALQRLLVHLAECAAEGQPGKAKDIAAAVFGRTSDFDSHNDSVVRVHASRLRSKLAEYYVQQGAEDPVLITLPKGSYELTSSLRESPAPQHSRRWIYWVIAGAVCILIAILAVPWVLSHRPKVDTAGQGSTPASVAALPGGPSVRILAGYIGPPHSDPSGKIWQQDSSFEGGVAADIIRNAAWSGPLPSVVRTNDEFLFQHMRVGQFTYQIPLAPGTYELHLYFNEPFYGPGLGGGEASRAFNVVVNGSVLLRTLDVEADALGPNIADERIIRDVRPSSDGKLHIGTESLINQPILNAIEIVPGLPHKQLPVRFTVQSSVYIGHDGRVWSPDNYFYNGQRSIRPVQVSGTDDPGLFALERFGHFNYAIPADPRDRYTVTLYFAEFYWGLEGRPGPGNRQFNVYCNGAALLRDFDIFREAGSLHGIARSFHHLKPTAQGKLNLTFEPVINNATLSAIEVTDESD